MKRRYGRKRKLRSRKRNIRSRNRTRRRTSRRKTKRINRTRRKNIRSKNRSRRKLSKRRRSPLKMRGGMLGGPSTAPAKGADWLAKQVENLKAKKKLDSDLKISISNDYTQTNEQRGTIAGKAGGRGYKITFEDGSIKYFTKNKLEKMAVVTLEAPDGSEQRVDWGGGSGERAGLSEGPLLETSREAAEPEAAAAAHKASLTVGTAVTWTEANLPGNTGGIIVADPFGFDIMHNQIWVVGAETGEGDFFFPRMLKVANQEEADRIVAITGKRKEAEAAHKASLPVGTTVTWRTGARTELEDEIGGYVVGEEEDCGDGVMGVDIIGAESGETELLPYADVVLATPLEIKKIAKAALSGAGSNEPDIIRFAEPLLAASDSTSSKAKKLRIRELVKRGIEEDIARQLLVDAGGDLGVALSRLSVAVPEGEGKED